MTVRVWPRLSIAEDRHNIGVPELALGIGGGGALLSVRVVQGYIDQTSVDFLCQTKFLRSDLHGFLLSPY
jgi:hypothetical protein